MVGRVMQFVDCLAGEYREREHDQDEHARSDGRSAHHRAIVGRECAPVLRLVLAEDQRGCQFTVSPATPKPLPVQAKAGLVTACWYSDDSA